MRKELQEMPLDTSDASALASVMFQAVERQMQQPACKCSDKSKWIELIQGLVDSHVCSRCILRVFGQKRWEAYSLLAHETTHPSQTVRALHQLVHPCAGEEKVHEVASEDLVLSGGQCSLCLGLLQHLMAQDSGSPPYIAQRSYTFTHLTVQGLQAVMGLISAGHDATFSVSVNDQCPLLILRQRLLSEHLASKYGWAFKGRGLEDATTISSVLKGLMFPGPGSLSEVDEVKLVVTTCNGSESDEALRPLFQDYSTFKKKSSANQNPPDESNFVTFCRDRANSHLSSVPTHILRKIYKPLWPLAPCNPSSSAFLKVSIIRPALYLAGRYLKLKRYMPQSKWHDPVTGQRIGDISLAERLETAILSVYKGSECKFIAGGREDQDVRMLGEGRPFVMEIVNPEAGHPSSSGLREIEASLSAADHGARAVGLTPCTRKALEKLKSVEESKEKTYLALCWSEKQLSHETIDSLLRLGGQGIEVMQDTPLRVLHRRASKIRPRRVWLESIEPIPSDPRYFNLKMRTQAGTYVKEFCHGDLGRTVPNLGSLVGDRTEILQLDVLAVHMGGSDTGAEQWP